MPYFLKTLNALLARMIQGYFLNFVILRIFVYPFRTIDAIASHCDLLALMELGLQCIAENSRRRGLA